MSKRNYIDLIVRQSSCKSHSWMAYESLRCIRNVRLVIVDSLTSPGGTDELGTTGSTFTVTSISDKIGLQSIGTMPRPRCVCSGGLTTSAAVTVSIIHVMLITNQRTRATTSHHDITSSSSIISTSTDKQRVYCSAVVIRFSIDRRRHASKFTRWQHPALALPGITCLQMSFQEVYDRYR